MTQPSKALQAAAIQLARQQCPNLEWSDIDDDDKKLFVDDVEEIIRAYAANVTEEMAEQCSGEIWRPAEFDRDGCEHTWQATPEQIRAAIEEGLK